jgi:hypothetical protein
MHCGHWSEALRLPGPGDVRAGGATQNTDDLVEVDLRKTTVMM